MNIFLNSKNYPKYTLTVLITSLFLIIVLFYLLNLSFKDLDNNFSLTITSVAMLTGALGALFSVLQRISSGTIVLDGNESENQQTMANGFFVIVFSLVSPVIGLLSAIILYVFFSSEIGANQFFPMFECAEKFTCDEFNQYVKYWKPKHATDYAKVVVWSFIAGFSERFVLNTLSQLYNRAED